MPLYCWFDNFLDSRAELYLIFRSSFGQWSFKKKCFWDLLTFMTSWNNIHSLHWISYFTTHLQIQSNPISFQFSFCDDNEKNLFNKIILFIWLVRHGKLDLRKTLSASNDSFFWSFFFSYISRLLLLFSHEQKRWLQIKYVIVAFWAFI